MQELLIALPVLIFSIVLHEVAHGWTALALGDKSLRTMDRLVRAQTRRSQGVAA